jgi:hypothetical protein
MRTGADMVNVIRRELLKRGAIIIDGGWVNNNRTHIMTTDVGTFMSKWSTEWFKKVNYLPEFIGKGPGFTINKEFTDSMSERKPFMLFATNNNPEAVYGMTWDEFMDKSATHQQESNQEWVYAIPVRFFKRWCSE